MAETLIGTNNKLITVKVQEKTVVETGSEQVIEPDTGFIGLSKVTVKPSGENSSQGGEVITGVNGKIASIKTQIKSVTPSGTVQNIEPDSGYVGLSTVQVQAVTSDVDENIQPENIRTGVSILGVEGTLGNPLQNKTATPSINEQVITADSGYDGLNSVTINAVTSAIDNNIQPSNIKKDVNILGVVGTLVDNSDAIIEGTATSITTNATKIAQYKFYYDESLTEFIGNNVLNVGSYAFWSFKSDFEFSLPNARYIEAYAFQHNAWYINKVELPNCLTINSYAFNNNSSQSSNNTVATLLLPKVKTIGSYAFSCWGSITSLNLPELTTIGNGSFSRCSSLVSVNLGNLTQIKQQCFQYCSSLTTIIIPNTSVCGLYNTTNSIPASSTQHITIYVPSSLISSYQTATNWSTLYNNGVVDFIAIS